MESTKYEGYKPESKMKVLREYDAPLKNKGKIMRVKHKARSSALEVMKNKGRYLGDINR